MLVGLVKRISSLDARSVVKDSGLVDGSIPSHWRTACDRANELAFILHSASESLKTQEEDFDARLTVLAKDLKEAQLRLKKSTASLEEEKRARLSMKKDHDRVVTSLKAEITSLKSCYKRETESMKTEYQALESEHGSLEKDHRLCLDKIKSLESELKRSRVDSERREKKAYVDGCKEYKLRCIDAGVDLTPLSVSRARLAPSAPSSSSALHPASFRALSAPVSSSAPVPDGEAMIVLPSENEGATMEELFGKDPRQLRSFAFIFRLSF